MLSGGTAIYENNDMDNYTEIGNYYCNANSIAQTLENCPTTSAFTLKVENAVGESSAGSSGYIRQTFTEYDTGRKIVRYRVNSTNEWQQYEYFSDDATLFTPQDVAITDGDYGHVNGNFKRIGSILVFSFYISLTKEYSTNYDALFTFNTIKSSARYDFPAYTSRETSIQVYDLLIPNNNNTPGFNIGNNISVPVGTTIFCSGAMLVTDK